MTELRGCIPILCTPFDSISGEVDFESLEREIEWVLAEGATGVATLALASEGYKLTDRERDDVADAVVKVVAGRVPVVVSADGTGTRIAIERAQRAAAIGADCLMVLPPYFVKPNRTDLIDYYVSMANAVDIPLMIQVAPQLTGVPMSPDIWMEMFRQSNSIRYVKVEGTPQGEMISRSIAESDGEIEMFCGWGGLGVIDGLERGIVGSMPAPNFTRVFSQVQDRFEAGDVQGANEVFEQGWRYVRWTMQSIDYSVSAAKEELRRRRVFASATMRSPADRLDGISRSQLDRWIDGVLEPSPA